MLLIRSGTFCATCSTASSIARKKDVLSAPPWLFITMPRKPTKLAPL